MPLVPGVLLACLLLAPACDRPPAGANGGGAPASTIAPAPATAPAPRPNVLLVTIDTCRADRIGCYGFSLARTPNLDRLACEGVRCTDAVTTAPITAVAHASILTGLLPPAHGVRDNGAYALSDDVVTLSERLQAVGYATQAFVSAVVLARRYNLTQGFDGYDDDLAAEDAPPLFMIRDRPATRTAERAVAWLRARQAQPQRPPFFLWVHFFDPHQPYEARVPNRHLIPTPYDAEIAAADIGLGMILDELRRQNLLDHTLTIVTADHGESLGEHEEKTHAIFVYDATVRVPLLWRFPQLLPAGRVYEGPVRVIDIAPTTLAALHLPGGEQTQGVNLLPALGGDEPPPELPQYSESLVAELGFGMAPLYAVRHRGWKYIRAPRPELYDLTHDPQELSNLYDRERGRAEELSRLLDELLAHSSQRGRTAPYNPLDRETLATLQALGYVASAEEREGLAGIDPKDGIVLYAKLEQARHLAQNAQWTRAETLLRELLEQTPGNVSARNILALCLLRQGHVAAAEQQYQRSLEIDARQNRVLAMLGQIRLSQRDFDAAERHLRAALAITPRFVEAMVLLGFIGLQRGDDPAAQAWYEQAVAEDGGSARVTRRYADLFFLQGDYARALEFYQRTTEAEPAHFEAIMQTGMCRQRLRAYAVARRAYQRAAAVCPDSWKPVYNLACLDALEGASQAALAGLREAVAKGLRDVRLLQTDSDLTSLRALDAFREIVEQARAAAREP